MPGQALRDRIVKPTKVEAVVSAFTEANRGMVAELNLMAGAPFTSALRSVLGFVVPSWALWP